MGGARRKEEENFVADVSCAHLSDTLLSGSCVVRVTMGCDVVSFAELAAQILLISIANCI